MERSSPLLTFEVIGELDDEQSTEDGVLPRFWQRREAFWRRRVVWLPAALLLVVVLVVALAVWRFAGHGPAPLTQADVDKAVQSGIAREQQQQRAAPPDAGTAYRRILPSMVTVVDSKVSPAEGRASVGESALGAGVVIDAQGDILTALHVVAGGGRIQVRFADGTQSTATVSKSQPASDIAVLAVNRLPSVVVPAILGGGVQVGDAVFPVGNPMGLQDSLSGGVVSALDRPVKVEGGRTLKGLIQFDAAVNPGNSGGPLLDSDGHVVGIVDSLANPSGQAFFVGIGFAIPIGTAGGVAGGPLK
jgi:S1-C subfamily serine protease